MYLTISIILAAILGYLLMMMGPLIGGLVAFGIVAGCLFRGLYLLNNIHKKLSETYPTLTKAEAAYEKHLKELDRKHREHRE
ncbi:hypothetical protein [Jeotgalibacillus terrae]|uniref:ATP-dependent Lon protease n=1 Tax=Jeotgalibacillus terrae TaxID=587735 RepID=A0ABW5ZMF2_9BACL|nr:large-conductance mechanosensitive channel [Jeotgalibacillus terrae]